MKMNSALPFSIVLPVLILFLIDPDTSLVADNTYKQNYIDIAASDDRPNRDKSNNKNGEHFSYIEQNRDIIARLGIGFNIWNLKLI
jgi:hypothetical protein